MRKTLVELTIAVVLVGGFGCLILWWGGNLRVDNTHSAEYWREWSERKRAETYYPTCEGRGMSAGSRDICLGGPYGGGTFEEMQEGYREYWSPENIREREDDKLAREVGWIITFVGGLVVLIAVGILFIGVGGLGSEVFTAMSARSSPRRERRAVATANGWKYTEQRDVRTYTGTVDGLAFRAEQRGHAAAEDHPATSGLEGDRIVVTVELTGPVPTFLVRAGTIDRAESTRDGMRVLLGSVFKGACSGG